MLQWFQTDSALEPFLGTRWAIIRQKRAFKPAYVFPGAKLPGWREYSVLLQQSNDSILQYLVQGLSPDHPLDGWLFLPVESEIAATTDGACSQHKR